jgi:hypothetical protein
MRLPSFAGIKKSGPFERESTPFPSRADHVPRVPIKDIEHFRPSSIRPSKGPARDARAFENEIRWNNDLRHIDLGAATAWLAGQAAPFWHFEDHANEFPALLSTVSGLSCA